MADQMDTVEIVDLTKDDDEEEVVSSQDASKVLDAGRAWLEQLQVVATMEGATQRFQQAHNTDFSEHVKHVRYLIQQAEATPNSPEVISGLAAAMEASRKDLSAIDASLAALCHRPAQGLPSACDKGGLLECSEQAIITKKKEIIQLEGELDQIKCSLHAKQLEIKQKEYVLNTCEKKLRKRKELQEEARLCALGGGSCGETTSCSKKAGCGCGCGGKKKKTVRRKKKCAKRKVTKKVAAEPAPVPTRSWGPSQVCFMPQPMMHC